VLDKEESTSKVRLLIWQGAIDMIVPHPPLEKPDGSADKLNWARPLIGYGPESMYVAYNRFYPPELAHYEKRNASPDRSHNETFDSLVTTGLIGFSVYMWLFASVFYHGFRWLGVIAADKQRNLFLGCWFVGGLVGALLFGFWQGPEFVGVGLPAGIAAGLGVYLVVWGLFLSPRTTKSSLPVQSLGVQPPAVGLNMLLVALVSAVIAHFVEIHFGIAIAATRLYFWAYLGLLVVVGHLLHHGASESAALTGGAGSGNMPSSGGRRSLSKGRGRKLGLESERTSSGLLSTLPYAILLSLILSTVAYGFVSNQRELTVPGEILWSSLTERVVRDAPVPSYGVLGMLGLTWFLGSAVIVGEWRRSQVSSVRQGGESGRSRETSRARSRAQANSKRSSNRRQGAALSWLGPLGLCMLVSFTVWLVFALIIAGRWASMVQQKRLLEAARVTMGMLTSYYVLAFLVVRDDGHADQLLRAGLSGRGAAGCGAAGGPDGRAAGQALFGIHSPSGLDRLPGALGSDGLGRGLYQRAAYPRGYGIQTGRSIRQTGNVGLFHRAGPGGDQAGAHRRLLLFVLGAGIPGKGQRTACR
jgi:hypothetical protein